MKLVMQNSPVGQVPVFKCLGCSNTYRDEKEVESKINLFHSICRNITKYFTNKTRKEAHLKYYNVGLLGLNYYYPRMIVKHGLERQKLYLEHKNRNVVLDGCKGSYQEGFIRNNDIGKELDVCKSVK